MTSGRIVLLNGSSSAGKTTLAHALQALRPEPWFHVALDQFRDGMPGRYRGLNSPAGTPGARGLNVVPVDKAGQRVSEIQFGDVGERMLRGMHRALAVFACEGNHVVMDDLCLNEGILADYVQALRGMWVLFVGVHAPLETVTQREAERPGRFPGTAISHFHDVHRHAVYDLEVDTSIESPPDCARRIAAWLDGRTRPRAFDQLQGRLRADGRSFCGAH